MFPGSGTARPHTRLMQVYAKRHSSVLPSIHGARLARAATIASYIISCSSCPRCSGGGAGCI